jgi:hypothetical protein
MPLIHAEIANKESCTAAKVIESILPLNNGWRGVTTLKLAPKEGEP